jgi:hypothetical protein
MLKNRKNFHTHAGTFRHERRSGMNDRELMNQGMSITNHAMETADDIVQALLATLTHQATDQQKHVLDDFARYVNEGHGRLQSFQLNQELISTFETAAKEIGLSYVSVLDHQSHLASIIIRSCDKSRLDRVVDQTAKMGVHLIANPQLDPSDFFTKYKTELLSFCPLESVEHLSRAKRSIANAGIEFTVSNRPDHGALLIFCRKDENALKEAGLLSDNTVSFPLEESTTIEQVKQVIQDDRRRIQKDRGKEQNKNHGKDY